MTNRTNKKLEEFKDLIDRDWQLDLNEMEFWTVFLIFFCRAKLKKQQK